jgi:hypothetical protein
VLGDVLGPKKHRLAHCSWQQQCFPNATAISPRKRRAGLSRSRNRSTTCTFTPPPPEKTTQYDGASVAVPRRQKCDSEQGGTGLGHTPRKWPSAFPTWHSAFTCAVKKGLGQPRPLVPAPPGLAIGLSTWHSAFTSPGAWRLALHCCPCGAPCERVQRRECPIFFDPPGAREPERVGRAELDMALAPWATAHCCR